MYTERSIELKSDFYKRYGNASLKLYFERTGLPCVLLDSGEDKLAFALGCGVRAYGRECGDVLRIINADSDECDVCFAPHGSGAQILYKEDIAGICGMRETVEYTIMKLLFDMQHMKEHYPGGLVELCDIYGSRGWCAYIKGEKTKQVPLPITHNNVILIRSGKKHRLKEGEESARFREGEKERIKWAAEALKSCRTDILFDMMNESEKAIERLLSPGRAAVAAVHSAMGTDGVLAARICDMGIICITEREATDSAIHGIAQGFERETGYPAGIVIVK